LFPSGRGPKRSRGEALLDADSLEELPGKWQAAILEAEGSRPKLRAVSEDKDRRPMIGFIVAGLIVGALARLLLPGRQKIGLLWTLLLGVAGSVIGGTIANALGTGSIWELNVLGFIVAVLSSVGLLAVAERAGLGQPPERKRLGRS
jgi:uncharacterized membrane protein YeaQ/YmgE (transglycosylase-associated protein family)